MVKHNHPLFFYFTLLLFLFDHVFFYPDKSHPRNDMSRVIYANEGVDIQDEDEYEGINIEKPAIASRTSKPLVHPRTSSQNANGKPVAMVPPAPVEKRKDEVHVPPPVAPYDDYMREKEEIPLQEFGIDSAEGADVSVAHQKGKESLVIANSKGLTCSQDNLEEIANGAVDDGEIYANLTHPQPILIASLEEYITNRKSGDTNELNHEFNVSSVRLFI